MVQAKLLERLKPKVFEATVDYLTISCSEGNDLESFSRAGQEALFEERGLGNQLQPHKRNGYEGFKAGSLFLGRRDDGFMCEASGGAAAAHWTKLLPHRSNCSRIDTQVTIHVADEDYDLQRLIYLQCSRFKDKSGGRLAVRDVREHKAGHTVYLGKPKSLQMGRCYNKWHESGEEYYRASHRYEVQQRNDAANWMAHQLAVSSSPSDLIQSHVRRYWASRGHAPPYSMTSGKQFVLRRRPGKLDDRLRWLASAGRKLADDLLEAGRFEELLAAWEVPAEVLLRAAQSQRTRDNEGED